jgi:peroxiredoxin
MSAFLLIASLVLWAVVFFLGFVLLGSLRALALLSWRLEQLEATTLSGLGRSGLRPGKKVPDFTLPTVSNGEVTLHRYGGRKLLLAFMQPGCGSCHQIVTDLSQLHDVGEVQVLVVQSSDADKVQDWAKEHRPRFPVALQERLNLSKRYEVFATPFAFHIDAHGAIAGRGILSTKQYLGFVLTRAGHDEKNGDDEAAAPHNSTFDAGELAFSKSREVDHV